MSTADLPWIWVIEALASANKIDTSILIDLVKRAPEVSDDVGRNAKELVSLRVLETLFAQEISNTNDDASVPNDKIEFNNSMRSEDVLHHLWSGVSSDREMAGPDVSKCDVQKFINKKRSCLPKCALQQIKDAILDSTNPLPASLKAKSGLEVGNHSRDEGRCNAVDLNGMKQSHEVRDRDAQNELVLGGNATPLPPCSVNGVQENQPRNALVPSKRRIDDPTAHEGEHSKTDTISGNFSDPCVKASKKFKQEVISPRSDVVHDFESSKRDGVAIELSAGIPQAIVPKRNLEIGSLVGGLDVSCEHAASKRVRQSIDSSTHDEPLPRRMISEEQIQNIGSGSNGCAELRTRSSSSSQIVHQDTRIHGTEDRRECNQEDLVEDEPSKGAKRNIVESDEPEFSGDSDGYHYEKTGLSVKRNEFVYSQCTQGPNLCVKCNEGGELLVCSLNTCPLVVHQSCLGSVPSFDNGGNFYCPFCAYSRSISEYLESKKMASLARNDLSAFFGFGTRRQKKKSSHRSRRTEQKRFGEDEGFCHDKTKKDSLNEVTEARSMPVCTNTLEGETMEILSPQPEGSVPHEPVAAGQKSNKSLPRLHRSKQKLSREEEELCNNENSNKTSPNVIKEPGNAPVNGSSPNADVTPKGPPQTEACAPPKLVSGQSASVEETSEDEETIASRYRIRFRNADKNYTYPAIPQVRQKQLPRKKRVEDEH